MLFYFQAGIPFTRESLNILEIPVIYYDTAFPLFVRELLLPSHTAPSGNYNKKFIHGVRNRFLPRPSYRGSNSRVYISRKKAKRRRIKNECEVERLLVSFGFNILCPEDHSLSEQIRILSEANMLVGLHGAGLTNMIFMPEGSNILEIRKYGDDYNNTFWTLASEFGHKYFYIQSEGDNANTHIADFTVDVRVLEAVLCRLTEGAA